jgi:hypothetical protein
VTYWNLVLRRGVDRFAADLAALYAADDGLTVSATVGATTAQVHFERADVEGLGGDRLRRS